MTDTADHITIRLRGAADLERLHQGVRFVAGKVGEGWSVVFTRKRSVDQNAKLHAMLADISAQAEWNGVKLSQEDWKTVLVAGWIRENTGGGQRLVVNWQRDGVLALGQRTRDLSVAQMSELIEFVAYAGATLGVTFKGETE